jgi:UDP-N-acetylglucosamine diphosphorylase / glucose-1-phosphate thymidylyltransferase / UDP-N-acetylgalactosamine diphosphorylase / glucosamine-1-phosphate N-acetyltransferase / galactosamine-1-phosphate N-acetyltransferase
MKQAIILAAGEGRRLRPFTVNKPNAMIYIAGKPIIQYVIEALAQNGIRDIIIVVGYKREQIFDYLGDGRRFGVVINYFIQNEQIGTAHALLQSRDHTDEEFLVLSGNKLITADTISGLIQSRPWSILVKRENTPGRYFTVMTHRGMLTDIIDPAPTPQSYVVNTGIYVFNKSIFELLKSRLDIPEVIREMLKTGINISAVETKESWYDVVYPWDIIQVNADAMQHISANSNGVIESGVYTKGQVFIGKGTTIRSNTYISGPVTIGEGCEIGPNTCIFPATSIGDNVVIAPFTHIKNSIIGDSVNIGPGCTIEDSIIDRHSNIGAHFCSVAELTEMRIDWQIYMVKIGAMIGEGCEINNGVTAKPGLIAGNYCQVNSLKIISGTLPDKSLVV